MELQLTGEWGRSNVAGLYGSRSNCKNDQDRLSSSAPGCSCCRRRVDSQASWHVGYISRTPWCPPACVYEDDKTAGINTTRLT